MVVACDYRNRVKLHEAVDGVPIRSIHAAPHGSERTGAEREMRRKQPQQSHAHETEKGPRRGMGAGKGPGGRGELGGGGSFTFSLVVVTLRLVDAHLLPNVIILLAERVEEVRNPCHPDRSPEHLPAVHLEAADGPKTPRAFPLLEFGQGETTQKSCVNSKSLWFTCTGGRRRQEESILQLEQFQYCFLLAQVVASLAGHGPGRPR